MAEGDNKAGCVGCGPDDVIIAPYGSEPSSMMLSQAPVSQEALAASRRRVQRLARALNNLPPGLSNEDFDRAMPPLESHFRSEYHPDVGIFDESPDALAVMTDGEFATGDPSYAPQSPRTPHITTMADTFTPKPSRHMQLRIGRNGVEVVNANNPPHLDYPLFESDDHLPDLLEANGQVRDTDLETHYENDPRRLHEGPRRRSTIDPDDLPFQEDCREWSARYRLTYSGSANFKRVARVVTFHADNYSEFESALGREMARIRDDMTREGQEAVAEWQAKSRGELRSALEADLRHRVHATVGILLREKHGSVTPCRNTCERGKEFCAFTISLSNIRWGSIHIVPDIYIPPAVVLARHVWTGPGNQVVHIYGWVVVRYEANFFATLACECTKYGEIRNR